MTRRVLRQRQPSETDRGAVLPIVLVISVVMALVVVAIATYASATLKRGQVAEAASDRLATAHGGMDNAIEDIERNASRCVLFGQNYTMSASLNNMSAQIDCSFDGGDPNRLDLFAIMLTGAGAGRTGPLLTITNGGNSPNARKVFEGPVYMAAPPTDQGSGRTLEFSATLTIQDGDLWYSNPTCPGSVSLPGQLTIATGYGPKCVNADWTTFVLPKEPPAPTVDNVVAFPVRGSAPPSPDLNGCYVWPPGRYNNPPNLTNHSYNYFQSGDYYFANAGNWSTSNAFVLFGHPGASGPSIDGPRPHDTLANNPCRDAWNEANTSGAAIYLGGDSRITVNQGSTFEVSGRDHSGYNVGIQALGSSSVQGEGRILATGPGSNKQLSIQGLVWAPYAAFEFDLISNEAIGALTGGAVVGELTAGASANANNFLIRVDTQPQNFNLYVTSTTGDTVSTAVRSNLSIRPAGSTTYVAVNSRRVVGLTPE